jgi:hypothetical protein
MWIITLSKNSVEKTVSVSKVAVMPSKQGFLKMVYLNLRDVFQSI